MADRRGYDLCAAARLEKELETNMEKGLTEAEAAAKIAKDGLNELEKQKPPTLFMLFVTQLINVIMLLLIASAIASLSISATGSRSDDPIAYVEGIAIFVIVFLNAGIAAFTENVANSALEALSKLTQANCCVLRDGQEKTIQSTHAVVGDILMLAVGDIVPADCRILDSNELKVNEMLLTGEPDDVAKTHKTRGDTTETAANQESTKISRPSPGVSPGAQLLGVPTDIAVPSGNDTPMSGIAMKISASGVVPSSDILKKEAKNTANTGNTNPAAGEEKLTPASMAFSSCLVTNGKAKSVITDIGMNTRVGAIAKMLQGASKQKVWCGCLPDTSANMTPLQVSINELGVKIGYLAIGVCFTVFLVGWALGRQDETDMEKPSALYMILVAVTLAVAAIPEGIPLCVTISLSNGANAMVERHVLVRRLAAVETLGSASVICTDKTGTLTEGKMTMVKMWSANVLYTVSGHGFDPTVGKIFPTPVDDGGLAITESDAATGSLPAIRTNSRADAARASKTGVLDEVALITRDQSVTDNLGDSGKSEPTVRSCLLAGLLCSNTTISKNPETGFWAPKGNSSEAPIVVAAAKAGFWTDEVTKEYERILEIPFNSKRKMMVCVVKISGDTFGKDGIPLPEGTKFAIIVKGAPNIILDACKYKCVKDGSLAECTTDDREEIMSVVDSLSSQALRVLAVAIRCLPELPFDVNDDSLTSDDKFLALLHGAHGIRIMGLFASIDPPREGVRESVKVANKGGVRVTMITGDYYKTALAIAKDINIISDTGTVDEITGHTIFKPDKLSDGVALDCSKLRPTGEYLSDMELDKLTLKTKVFARAKPEDKLVIVQSLQRQGLVCAMTGDGVNDAPALKQSDIGVAMGIQGTDVAKGASDMILTDDNFVSIVGAVERGRVIYAGIQKFVAFIMSVHIGEVMQIFFCVVAGIPIMRKPLQILFLILVTDLPPAVALGMEPGDKNIMFQRPRPKTQPIVLHWMWLSIVANGAILSIVIAIVYLIALEHYLGRMNQEDISKIIQAEKAPQDEVESKCMAGFGSFCLCRTLLNKSFDQCESEFDSTDSKLRQARTSTFIAVVFAENVRAYTSRSFDRPFYENMFSNKAMQKAILLAQIALWCVVLIPGLSDTIFELEGFEIGITGYLFAVAGAIGCLILCEIYKFIAKTHNQEHQLEELRRAPTADLDDESNGENGASMPNNAVGPVPGAGADVVIQMSNIDGVPDQPNTSGVMGAIDRAISNSRKSRSKEVVLEHIQKPLAPLETRTQEAIDQEMAEAIRYQEEVAELKVESRGSSYNRVIELEKLKMPIESDSGINVNDVKIES